MMQEQDLPESSLLSTNAVDLVELLLGGRRLEGLPRKKTLLFRN